MWVGWPQEHAALTERLRGDLAFARAKADKAELRAADGQAAQKRCQELEGAPHFCPRMEQRHTTFLAL